MRIPSAVLSIALLCAACGSSGGGGSTTTAPTVTTSGPTTVTLSGTTQQIMVNGATGCSGDSHTVTMADGAVEITLAETTDPAAALSVQVCQAGSDSVCSIKQQRINVGQKITGTRTGTASQIVKMLPFNCVFGGSFSATPITYKVTLTHQQ